MTNDGTTVVWMVQCQVGPPFEWCDWLGFQTESTARKFAAGWRESRIVRRTTGADGSAHDEVVAA